MPSSSEVANSVRVLFRDGTGVGASDGQLLDRFSRYGDEGAFAILVERHGPMVLRVCRSILGDDDALDAFQATFLVLVKRLRWIDRNRSVAPWLFGVARRLAVRARTDAAKRRAREREAAEARLRPDDRPTDSWAELYEELARLPEKYRAPLILCHLEGCSTEQAAARLGCPRGTILSRLSRGREQLKTRLTRRGLAPVAALLAAELIPSATAAVPSALADAVVRAASSRILGANIMRLLGIKSALSFATAFGLAAGAIVFARQAPDVDPPAQRRPSDPRDPLRHEPASIIPASPGTAYIPRKVESRRLQGHKLNVFGAAFSPDSGLLATGDASATFKLWDVALAREEASVTITPRQGGHAAIMALDFSPDGKTLAMACDDRTIRLLDVATREEKLVLPQTYFPNTLRFSPDGATLAWAVSNPGASGPEADETRYDVVLWDLAAGRERAHLAGHTGGIGRIAFMPDGKTIVSAAQDHTVRLWDVATGKERGRLLGLGRDVNDLAVSPDGRWLATANGDSQLGVGLVRRPRNAGLVSIWDVEARSVRISMAAQREVATGVAFSPDGRFLASSGQDDLIRIWDAATGEERAVLKGQETYVYGLVFSPDGKSLVSTGAAPGVGGGARLWRVGALLDSLAEPPR
mgnify:CR=1 FL=1